MTDKGRAKCAQQESDRRPDSLHNARLQILLRVNDDQPPICPRCGVTMVPAALSADEGRDGDWVCLECEELGEEE